MNKQQLYLLSSCKYLKVVFLSLFFSVFMLHSLCGQNQDSLRQIKQNDTLIIKNNKQNKAWLYSAILPGAGQAYNKKYWKVPLLYGLIGTLVFITDYNAQFYTEFSRSYAYSQMKGPIQYYTGDFSTEQLLLYKKKFRRSRDLNYIMFAGLYLINVVDAVVDANMFDYDVSKDLSLRIDPIIQQKVFSFFPNDNTLGVRLSLTF